MSPRLRRSSASGMELDCPVGIQDLVFDMFARIKPRVLAIEDGFAARFSWSVRSIKAKRVSAVNARMTGLMCRNRQDADKRDRWKAKARCSEF